MIEWTQMHECVDCHQVKPRKDFHRNIARYKGRKYIRYYICKKCWNIRAKIWRKKNPESVARSRAKQPKISKTRKRAYSKIRHSNKHFGGKRERVILRDKERCVLCGMTREEHLTEFDRDITVDHIDGTGRYSKNKNNRLENLQTLCLRCHGKKDHRKALTKI